MSWPKLSETLSGPRTLGVCQCCGKGRDQVSGMSRWVECDAQDKPTAVVVNLCTPCAEKIIEPHPRLYSRLGDNDPMPGSMPLCLLCKHREGLACRHKDLKANGGAGLHLKYAQPVVAMVDGQRNGRRCGWTIRHYPEPVRECAGREEKGHQA